jgi:hypothetical protein
MLTSFGRCVYVVGDSPGLQTLVFIEKRMEPCCDK